MRFPSQRTDVMVSEPGGAQRWDGANEDEERAQRRPSHAATWQPDKLTKLGQDLYFETARQDVSAMLAYLAWLVGSKTYSPSNSASLVPKNGP